MGWVNTIAQKASGFFGTESGSPQPPAGSKILRFDDALRRANQGDAYAQAVVSIYYSTGYLTERNFAKAYDYARKSAEQEHPLGLYRLGAIVQNGEGVPVRKDEGIQLKRIAFDGLNAMSGDPYAMTALGIMIFRGRTRVPTKPKRSDSTKWPPMQATDLRNTFTRPAVWPAMAFPKIPRRPRDIGAWLTTRITRRRWRAFHAEVNLLFL